MLLNCILLYMLITCIIVLINAYNYISNILHIYNDIVISNQPIPHNQQISDQVQAIRCLKRSIYDRIFK